MDIKNYLHIQFETYPRLLRDVISFLASEDIRNKIMVNPDLISTNKAQDVLYLKEVKTKHGTRFIYESIDANTSSGQPQKSASIAYWQWYAKKNTPIIETVPMVKGDVFVSRYKKWADLERSACIAKYAEWIASLKWARQVWAAHKKTSDYEELSEDDKNYVDTIGVLIDVMRKQAVLLSLSFGFDVTDKSNAFTLSKADDIVKGERLEYYPKYQSKLTPVFRFKIKELLS